MFDGEEEAQPFRKTVREGKAEPFGTSGAEPVCQDGGPSRFQTVWLKDLKLKISDLRSNGRRKIGGSAISERGDVAGNCWEPNKSQTLFQFRNARLEVGALNTMPELTFR